MTRRARRDPDRRDHRTIKRNWQSQTVRTHAKRLSVSALCFFSVYGALMFACKLALAPLPNIEPVSLMVILAALCFGWAGLWAVYVYVACELLLFGAGFWSVSYLYVWLILFIAARLCERVSSALFWALFSACFGLCFGFFCSFPIWATGGWSAALAWWQAGAVFDLMHGAGNFLIAICLFTPLRKILSRLYSRFLGRYA